MQSREIEALKTWVHSQADCTWVTAVFRAEGVLQASATRAKSLKAFDLTVDDAKRRLCKKRATKYRCVPYSGGEPEIAVSPHLHVLMELPPGVSLDDLTVFLNERWKWFIEKQHGREIEASVLVREYNPGNHEEQHYFVRSEGPTFSWGLEKVLFDHMRL